MDRWIHYLDTLSIYPSLQKNILPWHSWGAGSLKKLFFCFFSSRIFINKSILNRGNAFKRTKKAIPTGQGGEGGVKLQTE